MNMNEITAAKFEAERFLLRVSALEKSIEEAAARPEDRSGAYYLSNYPAQTGAIRRASLDLTRSLARMRKPS